MSAVVLRESSEGSFDSNLTDVAQIFGTVSIKSSLPQDYNVLLPEDHFTSTRHTATAFYPEFKKYNFNVANSLDVNTAFPNILIVKKPHLWLKDCQKRAVGRETKLGGQL